MTERVVRLITDRPNLEEDEKRTAEALAKALEVNREFYNLSRQELAARLGWNRNRLRSREVLLAAVTVHDLVKLCSVLGPLQSWIVPPPPYDEAFRNMRDALPFEGDD